MLHTFCLMIRSVKLFFIFNIELQKCMLHFTRLDIFVNWSLRWKIGASETKLMMWIILSFFVDKCESPKHQKEKKSCIKKLQIQESIYWLCQLRISYDTLTGTEDSIWIKKKMGTKSIHHTECHTCNIGGLNDTFSLTVTWGASTVIRAKSPCSSTAWLWASLAFISSFLLFVSMSIAATPASTKTHLGNIVYKIKEQKLKPLFAWHNLDYTFHLYATIIL